MGDLVSITLTKKEARELLVKYHMINTNDELFGKEGIIGVFKRLQSIQFDPLDVVGRNTSLVMQSRIKDYKRNDIDELLYHERVLIDGFDKMMAIYQSSDYNELERVRNYVTKEHENTLKYRNQLEALNYLDEIKNIISERPKFSSEINIGGYKKSIWGQSKISSAALNYLYFRGDIGVRTKKNTLKQYDLMENILKGENIKPKIDDEETFILYYLLRRIKSLGICRNKNGVHLSGPYISDKEIRHRYLPRLIEMKLIEEIRIEGLSEQFYIPVEALDLKNQLIDQISFIAPLDNLIWDRDLIEQLFDFKYRWEVYTPENKRLYGYYVLPMLYKAQFVGRIEFEKHRKDEPLKIKHVFLETELDVKDKLDEAVKHFETYLMVNK